MKQTHNCSLKLKPFSKTTSFSSFTNIQEEMIIQGLRICTFLIFLWTTVTITWQSIMALLVFIGALFLPNTENHNEKMHKKRNELKGKPKVFEEDLPPDIIQEMEHKICDFVTYNAETVNSVRNFESIQNNTECIFAKKAKLWGSPLWKEQLELEENILRSIPTFYKFCSFCGPLGLDGFVYELPGTTHGKDIATFGEAVCSLLATLSDNDPAEVHCMDKSYINKKGWVFEFAKTTFFVTTFAPVYPENHSRYTFGASNCFVLLQPEISFAQYDLEEDTPFTNWDNPRSARDRIRCAFRKAGRQYPIRDTVYYPMAHDIVRPIENDGEVVEWWTRTSRRKSCRVRTHSASL